MLFSASASVNVGFGTDATNVNSDKVSDALMERMSSMSATDTVRVSIDLSNTIDLDLIEQKVTKAIGISRDSITAFYETSCAPLGEPLRNLSSAVWGQLQDLQNEYLDVKRSLVEEFNLRMETNFLTKHEIQTDNSTILGIYSSYIDSVELTVEQISALSFEEDVVWLSLLETAPNIAGGNMGYIGQNQGEVGYQSIRGNMAKTEGYTGTGIKVALFEECNPDTATFGTNNVTVVNRHNNAASDTHAGIDADIIFSMVQNCTIYSCALGPNTTYHNYIASDLEYMINTYGINVANVSYGILSSNNDPQRMGKRLDEIVSSTNVTICVATGNGHLNNVSYYALGANVIAVGGVYANSRTNSSSGAYTWYEDSTYRDGLSFINRPDVSAPCEGSYLLESDVGTSFSCAYVTGTVAQMMSRNPAMKIYPESLKAAVMASATFNAGLPDGTQEIEGTIVSDKEGAGVVDAGFCLQVAGNGRRTEHTFTSTGSWNTNIYCDTTDKPFRVAVAWNVTYDSNGKMLNPEINIRLRKNGVMVASSGAYSNRVVNELDQSFSYTGLCTNYEIIELSPEDLAEHGAGYYELYVTKSGTMGSEGSVRVGAAWEQY